MKGIRDQDTREQRPENWVDGDIGASGSDKGLYQGNRDSASGLDRAVNLENYPGTNYPNAASVGDATSDEVRTHSLASGDSVWDLGGDLWNWVDADENGTHMTGDSTSKLYETNPLNSTVSGGDGLGSDEDVLYTNNNDAALRGGRWLIGDEAGVFQTSSRRQADLYSSDGFRCSSVPVS